MRVHPGSVADVIARFAALICHLLHLLLLISVLCTAEAHVLRTGGILLTDQFLGQCTAHVILLALCGAHSAHRVLLGAASGARKVVYECSAYRMLILLVAGMRVGRACLLLHDLRRLRPSSGPSIRNRDIRHLDVAVSCQLVLRVQAVRAPLSILGSGRASWSYVRIVVHYHLRLQ